jgi:transcriptional regulator with XRE-family HTH domain
MTLVYRIWQYPCVKLTAKDGLMGGPRPSPTVRGRRLAMALKHLRIDRGLTVESVSAQSDGDISASALSRWESRDRRIDVPHLKVLLDIYDVRGAERDELITLARDARKRGWWQAYGDAVPPWFEVYVGLEAEAVSLRAYDAELIPGLFQTDAYYRAIMKTAPPAGNDTTIDRMIAVRAGRRERLMAPDAPDFWSVINEAALNRVVGSPGVMREQLNHIAEMSNRERVTVQVLPFQSGSHPAMMGSFMIVGFSEPLDPDVVYVETGLGSLIGEQRPAVDRYNATHTHLVALALGPDESRNMIGRAAAALTDFPDAEDPR